MSITEATAVNVLLEHVLALPNGVGVVPTDEQAREAAALLADKASKALSAGLTGSQVVAAWPEATS